MTEPIEMQTIQEIVGGEIYEYQPLGEYIVRATGVCGGRPTFKYTRIEVSGALNRLSSGENLDDIAVGYAGRVPREALLEAIDISARHFIESLPELIAV